MERFFIRWSKLTLISILLIVVAGGVVRTTDSGMGCPDWPKCFGQWIPPTDVSQLPENYAEEYKEKYNYTDTTFNAFHTWTEYVNRLIGFLSGNISLVLFILSIVYFIRKRKDVWLIPLTFLLVALMGFQAWLGAKVVYSELDPSSITTHMVVAMLIIALNLYIIVRAQGHVKVPEFKVDKTVLFLLIAVMVLSFIQIIMGTQVRQEIDAVSEAMNHVGRESWIDQLTGIFKVHRSFAILVMGLNGYLIYRNWKKKLGFNLLYWLVPILIIESLSGIILAYMDVPRSMQPIHLVLANLMFVVQVYALLRYLQYRKKNLALEAA